MSFNKVTLLILIFIVLSYAQADNYWSWNFNTNSTLMSGSVVAGNAGPSAIFYNPSLINQDNSSSLSLSASVFSLQSFRANNIAGEGTGVSKLFFKVQPKFASYVLPTKSPKFGLQIAVLSPISEDIRFSVDHSSTIPLIDRVEGDDNYTAHINYSRKYDDIWAGVGVSYKHSDRFSVGLSLFGSDKLMRYSYRQEASASQSSDTILVNGTEEPRYIAQNFYEERLDYWFISIIAKAGLIYRSQKDRFNIGLNFTFPAIPTFGGADTRKSYSRSNIYDGDENSFVSNEQSSGLEINNKDIRIKSPLSVALGVKIITKNRKNTFSLSTEYFHEIDSYKMINSEVLLDWTPKYHQIDGVEESSLSYYAKANSVINGSVGYKRDITELVTYLGGFRTDFSSLSTSDDSWSFNEDEVQKYNTDKYHFTSGLLFEIRNINIIAGIQYTLGRKKSVSELANFSDPLEYNSETDQSLEGIKTNSAEVAIDEFALFWGISIGFE